MNTERPAFRNWENRTPCKDPQISYFGQRAPDSVVLSVCKHGEDGCKEDRACVFLFWTERIGNTWFKLRPERFLLDIKKCYGTWILAVWYEGGCSSSWRSPFKTRLDKQLTEIIQAQWIVHWRDNFPRFSPVLFSYSFCEKTIWNRDCCFVLEVNGPKLQLL